MEPSTSHALCLKRIMNARRRLADFEEQRACEEVDMRRRQIFLTAEYDRCRARVGRTSQPLPFGQLAFEVYPRRGESLRVAQSRRALYLDRYIEASRACDEAWVRSEHHAESVRRDLERLEQCHAYYRREVEEAEAVLINQQL
jgi:hypothetical protein